MGVQSCIIKTDFKVIAVQIEKESIARDAKRKKYLALVRRMENYFKMFTVEHIERSKNVEANKLVKAAARKTTLPSDVFFQTIKDSYVKTIAPEPRMFNVIAREDWRAPIMVYLCHYFDPDNNTGLIKMQQRAKAYQIINSNLHKTSVTAPSFVV
jgi:hypothetical protein